MPLASGFPPKNDAENYFLSHIANGKEVQMKAPVD
jgi:hypothetical protein